MAHCDSAVEFNVVVNRATLGSTIHVAVSQRDTPFSSSLSARRRLRSAQSPLASGVPPQVDPSAERRCGALVLRLLGHVFANG